MKSAIALALVLVALFGIYWTGMQSRDAVEQGTSEFCAIGVAIGSIPILWTIYKREREEKDRKKHSGRQLIESQRSDLPARSLVTLTTAYPSALSHTSQ